MNSKTTAPPSVSLSTNYHNQHALALWASGLLAGLAICLKAAAADFPAAITLSSGWQLQDAAKVPEAGEAISQPGYAPAGWFKATVPGTVLTSLVNDGVYPEPLYGLNNSKTNFEHNIPDSLARTTNWYRVRITVPAAYSGRQIWLNFDGINYMAEVFLNGHDVGSIKGAFVRGIFNVTPLVKAGETAAIAVQIFPTLHPGNPQDQTVALGLGPNGGVLMQDGPTFGASIGWDWMPAIRDRNIGIWQKVTLSASGPVVIQDQLITSEIPLPRTDSADISIQTTLHNVSDAPQSGILRGKFGDVSFQVPVTVPAGTNQVVNLTAKDTPALHLLKPRLWWPNGFGEPNLYDVHLSFDIAGATSDAHSLSYGIRKVDYSVTNSDFLTISVNGVPVFCKGGDWGMDEALKRISRERMENLIRLHKELNYTMIRNWVGQSTSEDLYDFCDRYGIMVWDEFFEANQSDGPTPTDIPLYLANVREKVIRFRNHASIVIWCGRNESNPAPPALAEGIKSIMAEVDPNRIYHANSSEGRGVRSGGPYSWRAPAAFYTYATSGRNAEVFKTEIGGVSIPTLESVLSMMPRQDAETFPNDDWAEHDLARGNNQANNYPRMISTRYGGPANFELVEFVREAQLANYEAYRALYEGRLAKMFNGSTAALTWMSNPAQPSTTWQVYSYDLEPFSTFFAVRKACEPVHVMLNQANFNLMVINNTTDTLKNFKVHAQVVNLDGKVQLNFTTNVIAAPTAATDLGSFGLDALTNLSAVHFVKVEMQDAKGKVVSDNFYWRGLAATDLSALQQLPTVTIDVKIARKDANGKCLLDVTLNNPGKVVALMAHVQLRKQGTPAGVEPRVLPVHYTDNYISLLPGESRTITIEADSKDLGASKPLVTLDGWNVTVKPASFSGKGGVDLAPNTPALVAAKAPTK